MVGAIQTFGQLIHWHPHIHALVSEGVLLPDGTFLPLPKLATEPFLKLWEQEVFALLLAEGKISEDVVANMRSWKHSGFSVDQSIRLEAGDQEGVQRLIQYFLRCPFSRPPTRITARKEVCIRRQDSSHGRQGKRGQRGPDHPAGPPGGRKLLRACLKIARALRRGILDWGEAERAEHPRSGL